MTVVVDFIADGAITAVTSPVTLAECLVHPVRLGLPRVSQAFIRTIVRGDNTEFVPIDDTIAQRAAEIRSRYNLTLPDAFQVAVALEAGCEAFLTNDLDLRRVSELHVVVLDDLEP